MLQLSDKDGNSKIVRQIEVWMMMSLTYDDYGDDDVDNDDDDDDDTGDDDGPGGHQSNCARRWHTRGHWGDVRPESLLWKVHHLDHDDGDVHGGFFYCSHPISVPKRKLPISQSQLLFQ